MKGEEVNVQCVYATHSGALFSWCPHPAAEQHRLEGEDKCNLRLHKRCCTITGEQVPQMADQKRPGLT